MDFFPLTALIIVAEVLTATLFFVLGACLGSFWNVVIYRVPSGRTLLGHSQCPHCGTKIQLRDNIPIWSWFRLQGKCRACATGISPRYWQIELSVALIWLVLAICEVALGGINLPVSSTHYTGFAFNLAAYRADLVGYLLVHALLMMHLLAIAMIERDGHRCPHGWLGCALAGLMLWGVLWPEVHPACANLFPMQIPSWWHLGFDATVGAVLGYALAVLANIPERCRSFTVWGTTLVATGLGLGALPSLTCVLVGLWLVWRLAGPNSSTSLPAALLVAAMLQVLFWRPLDKLGQSLKWLDTAASNVIIIMIPLAIFGLLQTALDKRTHRQRPY